MNTFEKYLSMNKTGGAEGLGIHPVKLWRWRNGKAMPRIDQAMHVQEFTKGKIKAKDILAYGARKTAENGGLIHE